MPKTAQDLVKSAAAYILQGDDELAISDTLQALKADFQNNSWGDMNIIQLDGAAVSREAVANAINLLPLGGYKKLVILHNMLDFAAETEAKDFLLKNLQDAPESTVLALVFRDSKKYANGKMDWQKVKGKHWLLKAMKAYDKESQWIELSLPSAREMPGWIIQEAKDQGGKFEGSAAVELARLIGENTLQARHEITKALSYTGTENPVTRDVIHLLCPLSTEEKIFSLVDAVGKRDGRSALALFQRLLEDKPIQYIFSMIARQIRQLIITKEIQTAGGKSSEIQSAIGVAEFVARKLIGQSSQFKMHELESIYHQLDRMDEASKTGRNALEVRLESMIAKISRI